MRQQCDICFNLTIVRNRLFGRVNLPPLLEQDSRRLERWLAAEKPRPNLVLCAGNNQGLLARVSSQSTFQDLRVIAVGFTEGPQQATKILSEVTRRVPRDTLKRTLQALGFVGTLATGWSTGMPWNPLLSLIASCGNLDWLNGSLPKPGSDRSGEVFQLLFRAMVQIAQEEPSIIVFDDVTFAPEAWQTLYYLQRQWPSQKRPIILAGIDGPKNLGSSSVAHDTSAEWSLTVRQASTLVSDGSAKYWYVAPLGWHRLSLWLGHVDKELGDLLLDSSGGDDVTAFELWSSWRRSGFVARRRGTWVVASQHASPILDEIIFLGIQGVARSTDLDPDIGQKILEYGAVMEDVFDGTLVAETIADECSQISVGDALTVLGALCGGKAKLLNRVIHYAPGGSYAVSSIRRYRFASNGVRASLRTDIASSQWRISRLLSVGRKHHDTDPIFASTLAHLAFELGQTQAAYEYRRAADRYQAESGLISRAQFLRRAIGFASNETKVPLTRDLLSLSQELTTYGFDGLAGELAEEGVGLIESDDSEPLVQPRGVSFDRDLLELRAEARYRAGDALGCSGDYSRAVVHLNKALEWVRGTEGGRDEKRRLTEILFQLGVSEVGRGRDPVGLGHLTEAQQILESMRTEKDTFGLRDALADTLQWIAIAKGGMERYIEASQAMQESYELEIGLSEESEMDSPRKMALSVKVRTLGELHFQANEYEEAFTHLTRARRIQESLLAAEDTRDHREKLATTLVTLGSTERARSNCVSSYVLLTEARQLLQDLIDQEDTSDLQDWLAQSIFELALVELARQNPTEAYRLLNERRGICQDLIKRDQNEARVETLRQTLRWMAHLERSQGRLPEAEKLEQIAEALSMP